MPPMAPIMVVAQGWAEYFCGRPVTPSTVKLTKSSMCSSRCQTLKRRYADGLGAACTAG